MKPKRFLVAALLASVATPSLAQDIPAFRVPLQKQATSSTADPTYSWIESVSSCSTTCGTGTRTTSYQCQDVTQFDYTAGDFGAPEAEAQCVSTVGAKPAGVTNSCTVYSGCNYDWVTPPEAVTPIAIPGYPVGRAGCGQVQRAFSPYCERSDGTQLAAGDHAFCSGDLPDYNGVRDGVPGALGYDNTAIETGSCVEVDHHWETGAWGPSSSTCSATAFQTRPVACIRTFDGTTQADAECSAPKPATTQTNPDYSGCSYAWQNGAWGSYDSTCSATATRYRSVWCRRSDGTTVSDASCNAGSRPAESDTNAVYSGCTFSWKTGVWGAWDSTCSTSANRSRSVWCERSDGTGVASSNCDAGSMPAASQTQGVYSSCSYSWQTSGWSAWDSTCSTSANRTRSVSCLRSDGTTVADSSCDAGTKPTGSQTQGVYSSCSYGWAATAWSAWDSNCSTTANRTRSVTCRRSDGATVADSNCTTAKWAESETQARYGSCTYGWTATAWSAWDSNCSSSASRTRSVTCRRSNGDTVADSNCTDPKWAESETQARYGSCSYSWVTSGWSGWSSTCSSSAVRTRSVTCRRSDGSTVSDASCDAGTRPASSDTQAVYSGCSYNWGTNAWSAWNSTCSSSANRTRTIYCRRSDGSNVSWANCDSGTQPATSQTQAVYSGCSYSWNTGAWSGWNSTCSSSATRTRSVNCRRSDGTNVGDANCTTTKPAGSETQAVYSGCGYSWNTGSWGAWSSTCSSSANRTRSVACLRSDGATVSDSSCDAGTRPSGSQTQAVYSGCSYSWNTGAWSAWSSTCSSSATRTRSVNCRRSDGTNVSDANCTTTKPAGSETQAVYSGCGYSWNTGAWSGWSSTCSSTAMRTRSVTCRRSDGTTVADANCTTAKPASSDSQGVYTSCTYEGTYGTWSACSGGTQSRSLTSCTRSDGANVALSNCTNNGVPASETQACGPCGTWQQDGTATLTVKNSTGPEGSGFYVDTAAPAPSGMTSSQRTMRDNSQYKAIMPNSGNKTRVFTTDGLVDSFDTTDWTADHPTYAPPTSLCVQNGLEYWTAMSKKSSSFYDGGTVYQFWGKCVCN